MFWYNANLKNIACYSRHKFNMLTDLQKLYRAYLAGELGVAEQPQGGKNYHVKVHSVIILILTGL